MPELPEVETIRQALRQGKDGQPPIVGMTIRSARLFWGRTLAYPAPGEFEARIAGQTIREIGRRGKFLILHLSPDHLLFHLRMSGDLLVEEADLPIALHHRLVLDLEKDLRLAFNDTRKFGRAWLVTDPEEVLSNLGIEPFDPALTPEEFDRRLRDRRRQIKPLLLDQSFLAGLGNIYTDEALHLAGLHPLRLSHTLTPVESERLLLSIREVLQEGIQRNGASIDWVYRGGDFQNYFRVYQRTGLACPACGTMIQRLVVGQRGTHYCPTCQPSPFESWHEGDKP